MPKFQVTFQPEGKRIPIEEDKTIMDAAIEGGIDLTSLCGGKGICGKCKVIIRDLSAVSELTDKEKKLLTKEEIAAGIRLACLTCLKGNVVASIPEYSKTGKQRLQVEGIETKIKVNPNIKKYHLKLDKPDISDPRADVERVLDALKEKFTLQDLTFSYNALTILSEILRISEWQITVVIWDNEIISIEPHDTTDRKFGYAVDIGTTKLAGYLLNLNDGMVVEAGSLMNPQIPYGEDVIARLNYEDYDILNKVIIKGLNQILEDLKERSGIRTEEIYEMTAVGNPVMQHLFLNLNPRYLGTSPYPPVLKSSLTINNDQVKLALNKFGKVFFLPIVAGFVGADTIGVVLATEIHKREELCLALDIGTNTEVVLGNKDRMVACSCASGPAFEGAHIRFGMRAASGSIEKIKIHPETYEVEYQTVDDAPPVGICGSGLIDLFAELLKVGLIDIKGTFKKDLNTPKVRKGENGREFLVVPATESGIKMDITFSQGDIRQLTLAKAAMQTGVRILMSEYGVDKSEIDTLFLAGAFGSHINKESARMIGIYPELPFEKVKIVGNAAGTGARMCLVSKDAKNEVDLIAKKVEYVELAAHADFQKEFIRSNFIPYNYLEEYPETMEILKINGYYPEKMPPRF